MSVKLLTEHNLEFISLKGGCTGSSKSILVKMPHCWKSHVTAQIKYNFRISMDVTLCEKNGLCKKKESFHQLTLY